MRLFSPLGIQIYNSIEEISNTVLEAYSEPSQTSKMELFVKIDNKLKPLTIFSKSSIFMVDPPCKISRRI